MTDKVTPGLVSVIVASYNHASFLDIRMKSLVNQTYQALEIIVIDDCSTDNSVRVLQAYTSYPQVKLIVREKNGGWVAVSNQGINISQGEYVLFANCDDDCDPYLIERLVEKMTQHTRAGLVFCRSLMIDEHGNRLGDDFEVREQAFRNRCKQDCSLSSYEMRRFLMHSCVIPNLSAALIRRDCFEKVGLLSSEYKACSDWDLFFRIADHFDFSYVATPLNYFRQHGRTIRSVTKGRVTYDEFFRVLLKQLSKLEFSASERNRFRMHIMYLWAVELLRYSTAGLINFPHHARLVNSLDRASLFYLFPALLKRVLEFPAKAIRLFLKVKP